MKDDVLNAALREVVSREFADIPQQENKIDYAFSDDFMRRMDKLTKAEKSRFWRMTNTIPKRVAAVFVAIMLIALTACSIPTVRAAVVDFIKETYDNCIRLFTGETGSKKISAHYVLTDLPDGFEEISTTETGTRNIVSYQNANGDQIILTQSITEDYAIFLDNENGDLSEINLSGMKVSVYESDDCMVAIWLQDQYAFHLTIDGDYDMDFIIKQVGAVKRQ